MASMNPTIHEPLTGRGGRGDVPPPAGGGGDSRGGDSSPDYLHRLRRARLGLFVLMVPILMLFVSFTSAYIVRKGVPSINEHSGQLVRDWMEVNLPLGLLLVNTCLLLASSVTMEFARRKTAQRAALAPVQSIPGIAVGREKTTPWLGATVLLGLGFLIGQWMAWHELQNRGFYIATNPSSSFVYLLTACHAIHLFGGIFALLYAGSTSLLGKPAESQRIVVDVVSWYWHFMAVLWVYVFGLLALVR